MFMRGIIPHRKFCMQDKQGGSYRLNEFRSSLFHARFSPLYYLGLRLSAWIGVGVITRGSRGRHHAYALSGLMFLSLISASCTVSTDPLTGETSVPLIFTPRRIDVSQGNFITPDMLSKLAVGQTREQVRFIMGTAVAEGPLTPKRWDYVYRFTKGWNPPELRRLSFFFDDNFKLVRWDFYETAPPIASDNGATNTSSASR